jgi:hypothetical protein
MSTKKRCPKGFRKSKSGECLPTNKGSSPKNKTMKSRISTFEDMKFETTRRPYTADDFMNQRVELRCNFYNNMQEEFTFDCNFKNTHIRVYSRAKTEKGSDKLCAKLAMVGANTARIESIKPKCGHFPKEEVEKVIRDFGQKTYLEIQ